MLSIGKGQEYPAPFLAAFKDCRVREDLKVPRYPRLTLAKYLRELANREFH